MSQKTNKEFTMISQNIKTNFGCQIKITRTYFSYFTMMPSCFSFPTFLRIFLFLPLEKIKYVRIEFFDPDLSWWWKVWNNSHQLVNSSHRKFVKQMPRHALKKKFGALKKYGSFFMYCHLSCRTVDSLYVLNYGFTIIDY